MASVERGVRPIGSLVDRDQPADHLHALGRDPDAGVVIEVDDLGVGILCVGVAFGLTHRATQMTFTTSPSTLTTSVDLPEPDTPVTAV